MRTRVLAFLITTLLLTGCKSDGNNNPNPLQAKISSGHNTFLVFTEEQKIEAWLECDALVFQDSFSCKISQDILPGFFMSTEKTNGSGLSLKVLDPRFSPKYHQIGLGQLHIGTSDDAQTDIILPAENMEKLKTGKRPTVIIVPNDFRKSGKLSPCFACPHWMAEIYAQLELSLEPYQ